MGGEHCDKLQKTSFFHLEKKFQSKSNANMHLLMCTEGQSAVSLDKACPSGLFVHELLSNILCGEPKGHYKPSHIVIEVILISHWISFENFVELRSTVTYQVSKSIDPQGFIYIHSGH